MRETLLPIRGYEGRYKITETGKVWSSINRGIWLKPFLIGTKRKQYYAVDLGKKTHRIHVLVANTFIPNTHNLNEINHKDGNRLNNQVNNLEWCTHQENMIHAQRMGLQHYLYGTRHPQHRLTFEEVLAIREKRIAGATLKELSILFHSCISNISYICRKETRING